MQVNSLLAIDIMFLSDNSLEKGVHESKLTARIWYQAHFTLIPHYYQACHIIYYIIFRETVIWLFTLHFVSDNSLPKGVHELTAAIGLKLILPKFPKVSGFS